MRREGEEWLVFYLVAIAIGVVAGIGIVAAWLVRRLGA
jgi:hypothetical protein